MTEPAPLIALVHSVLPEEPFAADPLREPLWIQLGADRCRVAVIDLQLGVPVAWRWMRDGGVSSGAGSAQPLEHVLPGAETLLDNWIEHTAGEPDSVITHMLSPRRWVYFWRTGERLGLLVQIHFLTGRNSSHAFDTAGLRVLCEHWLGETLRTQDGAPLPSWDRVDRRTPAPMSGPTRIVLACLAGCLLVALWIATFGASMLDDRHAAQRSEVSRLAQLSNQSLQTHLVQALAGGDYGLAQEVLSLHKGLDHFAAAAVINPRGLVVAHVGFVPPLPVGQPLATSVSARAQALALASTGGSLGELHLLAAAGGTAGDTSSPAAPWRVAGGVLAALLLLAAMLVARWPAAVARFLPAAAPRQPRSGADDQAAMISHSGASPAR